MQPQSRDGDKPVKCRVKTHMKNKPKFKVKKSKIQCGGVNIWILSNRTGFYQKGPWFLTEVLAAAYIASRI